jgi:hypothetical protein
LRGGVKIGSRGTCFMCRCVETGTHAARLLRSEVKIIRDVRFLCGITQMRAVESGFAHNTGFAREVSTR